ncbi:hypothetical protein SEA_DATBOI_57 [Gordonia phage DatBoi]|nr:hypothetical protein SEA_DATBOI_57 [Gordonia phage DatBoi]
MDDEATLADIGRGLLRKPIHVPMMTAPMQCDDEWGWAQEKDLMAQVIGQLQAIRGAVGQTPVDAYEYLPGPPELVNGDYYMSDKQERFLAEPYRSLRAPLRDFTALASCPHCDHCEYHWLNLIPVPDDEREEWGADEVLIRICRSCRLSWREAQ